MSYAEHTSVPVGQSKAEVERTLQRYGAVGFASAWEGEIATVMFKFALPQTEQERRNKVPPEHRAIRLRFKVPFEGTPAAQRMSVQKREQEERRIWRAALLVIKAKLESVESGIETFEQAWLAHVVVPGGGTVGDQVLPRIAGMYAGGPTVPLLGSGT